MNIHQIYSYLIEGKTLQLPFPSSMEAEKFRIKLAQYKLRKDKTLLALEILNQSERQKVSFTCQLSFDGTVDATIAFKDQDITRQYEVKILEDDPVESGGENA